MYTSLASFFLPKRLRCQVWILRTTLKVRSTEAADPGKISYSIAISANALFFGDLSDIRFHHSRGFSSIFIALKTLVNNKRWRVEVKDCTYFTKATLFATKSSPRSFDGISPFVLEVKLFNESFGRIKLRFDQIGIFRWRNSKKTRVQHKRCDVYSCRKESPSIIKTFRDKPFKLVKKF